jgi:hypothetical protein
VRHGRVVRRAAKRVCVLWLKVGALQPRLVDVVRAATYLPTSPWTVRDLIRAGTLRIAGRSCLPTRRRAPRQPHPVGHTVRRDGEGRFHADHLGVRSNCSASRDLPRERALARIASRSQATRTLRNSRVKRPGPVGDSNPCPRIGAIGDRQGRDAGTGPRQEDLKRPTAGGTVTAGVPPQASRGGARSGQTPEASDSKLARRVPRSQPLPRDPLAGEHERKRLRPKTVELSPGSTPWRHGDLRPPLLTRTGPRHDQRRSINHLPTGWTFGEGQLLDSQNGLEPRWRCCRRC